MHAAGNLRTNPCAVDFQVPVAKLADFGFATATPAATDDVCGTAEYVAPEVISQVIPHHETFSTAIQPPHSSTKG